MKKPSFLIAAPHSGSGKTTITLGLLRAFNNRGMKVQPFKCGPDYLDPWHHRNAAGKHSVNLDLFMADEAHVKSQFSKGMQTADVGLAEGVMGLFDGAHKAEGSSAEIAKLLNLPVILVVDARSTAYSVAPLLYGYKYFDPAVNLVGVIFNFVNSESHCRFLNAACKDVDVPCLGYLPQKENLKMNSRHLGLSICEKDKSYDKLLNEIASHVEKHIDLNRLIKACSREVDPCPTVQVQTKGKLKIAVARDEAFNFYYTNNLEQLETLGTVTFFSPLRDACLPEARLVYLGGGYPELYLEELSANPTMLESIRSYCDRGGALVAECGGMMFLGRSITDKKGKAFPMVGFLNIRASIEPMKLTLGYRKFRLNNREYRGHEFHYSTLTANNEPSLAGKTFNATGHEVDAPVFRKKNVLASYIHFYWQNDGLIREVV